MKFTCDSCSAQYMISDDKVGPNGVKVRCKKCGKVVLVRRAAEVAPAAAPATAPAAGAPAPAGAGLDAELGHAFDNVFGDPGAASAAAPQPGADPGATQAMGSEDRERIESAPAPAPTEWYVAIGQAQVGPLPLAEVKRKWEAGDVGPDSLVWRPGMTDWQAVTAVPELAGFLAPVPRPAPKAAPKAEPQPSRDRAPAATPAPAGGGRDVSWKPAGASALAALASAEIASRGTPEVQPAAAQAPAPTGVKSLVDALPDGGGVDPTGALPLSIKGLETTGEKKLERRSTVAHRAEEARHRRSVSRAIVVGVVLLAVVAAAAGGGWWYMNRPATPPAVATATPPPAPAVAQPTPPVPPPAAAPEPAVAAAPPAPPPPAAEPPAAEPPAAPPEVAAVPAQPAPPAAAPPARGSRTRAKREPATRVAAAPTPAPAPQAPAPTPAPPPAKKRNGLLDFDSSSDSALDEALGGGGSGRTVYVPPARPGGNGALPEKLSPSQINEAVAGRIDSLRTCVSEQKQREPGASGVLKMRWIIGGDGGVRDVKCLTSEYAQGPFAQCITGVVKTIKFPRSATTGQEVTFPFSF